MAQKEDPHLRALIDHVISEDEQVLTETGVLQKKSKSNENLIVVPRVVRRLVLEAYRSSVLASHLGVFKT
ncbi:hypothetical protein B566_EDAN015957 [Ephemera danica]|nr:hypothetical protein B566_EDAN015957 [Ephemera danica]